MTDGVAAYPLAWPPGRPRTPDRDRKGPAFRSAGRTITPAVARTRVSDEVDLIRGRLPVLSSNLELRLDGQPRAGQQEPRDPGVALYFRLADRPVVLACDRWITVAGNMAAIAAHIEALRGQERWGVGTLEQAFAGFMALPQPASQDWREVLGHPATLGAAEHNWREGMRTAHPDRGGSAATAALLNVAIAEARAWFKLASERRG